MAAAEKSRWRARLRQARDAVPAALRGEHSRAACERALAELEACRQVGLYAAKASELDATPLALALRARGCTILYPRAEVATHTLAFVRVDDEAALVPGAYGVREPRGDAVALDELDAIVAPGLGFDEQGGRLGFGAGYYDRVLAAFAGLTVGLAFEAQIVPRLPREPHDRSVRLVVTERRVLRASDAVR